MHLSKLESLLTRERVNAYAAFFVISSSLVWLWIFFQTFGLSGGIAESGFPLGFDFLAFWSTGNYIYHQEGAYAGVYSLDILKSHQQNFFPRMDGELPWLYPPHALLAVAPLGALPYRASLITFIVLSFFLYSAVAWRFAHLRACLWPVLGFSGVLITILSGQNSLISTAFFAAALYYLPSRPLVAGLFFGLLSVKPQLGLLIPLALLLGRQWLCFTSATITTVALASISVLFFGIETIPAFIEALGQMQAWIADGVAPLRQMPTSYAFFLTHGMPEIWARLLHGAGAACVATAVGWLWYHPNSYSVKAAGLAVGAMLVTPYLLRYDLALLAVPIAFLTAEGSDKGWLSGERATLVLLWLLPLLSLLIQDCSLIPVIPYVMAIFLGLLIRRSHLTNKWHSTNLTLKA